MNDEFDECRNFAINIYLLLEKNLDNDLLDDILFKNISKDNNFIFICISRLKENENKKIIEDKEEIRLKILQFLYEIVKRSEYKHDLTPTNLLNFYIYHEDILISLVNLINDPFPAIKKISCELLYELHFEKKQAEFDQIYRKLLKNLLNSLNNRQNEVRELILKCLKILMCYDVNREFLENALECLKGLCKKKSNKVFLEIVNCIKEWYLSIKNLNNIEKAKLVFIIILCINANISPSLNEHCYKVLEAIAKAEFISFKEVNHLKDQRKISTYKNECFKRKIKIKNLKNDDCDEEDIYKEKAIKVEVNVKEENISNIKTNNHENFENYEQCIEIDKLFFVHLPFNKITTDIHKFFCNIKKELFYEIVNEEQNSWSEGKEEFIDILTMFLVYTYNDNFYFIKNIFSFLYKSLTSFKYIDYPPTFILVNNIFVSSEENGEKTIEKYYYERKSFIYLRKLIYLIIACGYSMPIGVGLSEIAQMLLGDNIENILENFYKFCDICNEINNDDNSLNNYKEYISKTEDNTFIKEYIFSNTNYHKYLQKIYKKKVAHKKEETLLKQHFHKNYEFNEQKYIIHNLCDENEKRQLENGEYKNKEEKEKEEKKNMENKNDNIIKDHKKENFFYENISGSSYILLEENIFLQNCDENGNYAPSIIYENKKVITIMFSQFLSGYYMKNCSIKNKLNNRFINFILFLINENMNSENVDIFPYILITLKQLIHIMKHECKNYSNILFHILIILESDSNFCSHSEINTLIETLEYYINKKRINFYNYEFINFIKNAQGIIDFNDFKNFKYNLDFLNTLLLNVSEHITIKYSDCLMNFLYLIIKYELKPLIKSEFLLFINFLSSKNKFSNFFLIHSHDILKSILLPLCTWKSGLSEAEIRKGALSCIRSLFINNLFDNKIFQNNILIENLICVLKSSIDDVWNSENREISVSVIGEIAKNISNNNLLLDLLDTLVKLLDDSNKSIRKHSATSLYSLFQNKSLILSDEKCEHIFPILLLHMDDDYSSFSKIIYLILMIAKNFNNEIFLKHAKDSTESSLHAKSFKEDLMK